MDNSSNDPNYERLREFAEREIGRNKTTQILLDPKNLPRLLYIFKMKRDTAVEKRIDSFWEDVITSINDRVRRIQSLSPGIIAREEATINKIFKSFEKDNFASIDSYINQLNLKKNIDCFIETLPKDQEELNKLMREGMQTLIRDEAKLSIVRRVFRAFEYGKHHPEDFQGFDDMLFHQSASTNMDNNPVLGKRVKLSTEDHKQFREFLDELAKGLTAQNTLSYDFFDNFCEIDLVNLAYKNHAKIKIDFQQPKIFIESNNFVVKEVLVNKLSPNQNHKENLVALIDSWKTLG
jgi:hypothetical protein